MILLTKAFALTLLAWLIALPASAQFDPATTQIRATEIRSGIYMFMGAGGNLAVSTGSDGVLIVDDQFPEMTDKINAAITEITDAPLLYVVNTHWHWDHTGGNENFGKMGKTIIAHENTYVRMSSDQFVEAFNHTEPAAAPIARPKITFNDEAKIRFNDLTMHMIHVPNAHTDSDAFVHFVEANVIHSGDVFTGAYPFIDSSTGGTFAGEIAAIEKLASLIDDETVIIPGHGPLTDRTRVIQMLGMLKDVYAATTQAVNDGKTLAEFLDSDPTGPFDEIFAVREDAGRVFATRAFLELSGDN